MSRLHLLLPLVALMLGAARCDGQDVPAGMPVPEAVLQRMEVPRPQAGDLVVHPSDVIDGDTVVTYVLAFDPVRMHARWVAFRFDPTTRVVAVKRTNAWADDEDLPDTCRIGTVTFQGYSRGHLCASADRLYSAEANRHTFRMSNMSPQLSNLNAGLWSALESFVQKRGRSADFADTLYVVKGGTLADDQTLGDIRRPNGAFVAIPKYYWMALLAQRGGAYDAMGFWVEHHAYSATANAGRQVVAQFAVTIDDLEQRTGIDFFHHLPDSIESRVEATFSRQRWGLP